AICFERHGGKRFQVKAPAVESAGDAACDNGVTDPRMSAFYSFTHYLSVQRALYMQVSVDTTSGLERRMTVGIPAERIENEVNKRLQQTARRARVDGFRPGKVPMSVIRKRFGASARQEVIGEMIQSSLYEAIVQEKLNPAGAP